MQTHIETVKVRGTVEPQHYHVWYVSQRTEPALCSECGQVVPSEHHKGPKRATRMDKIYKSPQSANVGGRRQMARNEDPDIKECFVRQCAEDCEDSE